ncbi:ribbon-helix-helix protein, CopG family [Iamia sp. SCSIO 61187]|uniref:ribbon-helix-helix domain-containing protein n=1 Tax=Iamia sp. SCSIO 61187 TaxID=2722752 RepID=UPI001C63402A|nr:ribbon-helix-helix domain-containing protein [Iamia sp. SCSIO 61187]QYG93621.1 ribbon-helix-helix protein, CopG family [Iamia sp. SCSIO 61187]
MPQLVTRLDDDLAEAVDALVRDGVATSRSDAVRLALRRLVDRHRRDQIGDAIVKGYRRVPQADDEAAWSDAATAAMVAEEPW